MKIKKPANPKAVLPDVNALIASALAAAFKGKGKGKGKGKKGKEDKGKVDKGKQKGKEKWEAPNDFIEEPPKSQSCEYFQVDKCTKESCLYVHSKCAVAKAHLEWRLAVNAKRALRKGKGKGGGTPGAAAALVAEEEEGDQSAWPEAHEEAWPDTWAADLAADLQAEVYKNYMEQLVAGKGFTVGNFGV